jgi:glucose-1-phosphate adenylyltransferase
MTIGCLEVPLEMAKEFGVMSVNEEGQIVRFAEKPAKPEPTPNNPNIALASMGIYVFDAEFLYEQLKIDSQDPNSSHDFGKDLIPSLLRRQYRVFAHRFEDVQNVQKSDDPPYWRDVGTVDAFWEANIDLVSVTPKLNLYDTQWPIWTYQEQLPSAKFIFNDEDRRGMAVDSMVSGGCLISGAKVLHSLLFSNVKVNSYSVLEHAVVLPDVDIGRHCHLKRVVIDKGCVIPPNTVIGQNLQEDAKRFYVSEQGIVLVTPDMLGQPFHQALTAV